MPLGIRLSVNNVRVEYDGVKGIMTVGLSRKEHGRSTAVAENTIRDQLWEGGNICFGHWGQPKDGMQCRGSEGMYLGLWSSAGHATCNCMLCVACTLHHHSMQLQGVQTGV